MHLAVPLRPGHTYAQARGLVQVVAQALERANPGLVTTEWDKSRRRGVLIDSNQVGYGRTMSVAYCVRPRPGAPVSMPLTWDEVESGAFARARPTMRAALRRIEKLGDPFADALAGDQKLPAATAEARRPMIPSADAPSPRHGFRRRSSPQAHGCGPGVSRPHARGNRVRA